MHSFEVHSNESACRKKVRLGMEQVIREISGKGANTEDWLENYPIVSEYIDERLPQPRGIPLSTNV